MCRPIMSNDNFLFAATWLGKLKSCMNIEFINHIFLTSDIAISGLNSTSNFLPRYVTIQGSKNIEKHSEVLDLTNCRFNKGGLVVFYKGNSENISHVMVAIEHHTIIGYNNLSTYPSVGHTAYAEIDTSTEILDSSINLVRTLSPQQFLDYHYDSDRVSLIACSII